VISALFYLQYYTLRNRTVARFKRLKNPKYLIGGIVGALYFYFYFFRYIGAAPGRQTLPTPAPISVTGGALASESLGAIILFTIVLLSWLVPRDRAALTFTEAEVAFLFPAPISRRGLIHFKLLRSQTAILFMTLFLTVVTRRFGGHPWIRAAGWWLIISTLNLHFLGSSFARTMLLDRGITHWKRRLAILLLLASCLAAVMYWAHRTLPPFTPSDATDFNSVADYLKQFLQAGPVPYLLYPFRLVVRPYLAKDGAMFLAALPASLAILLAHYLWVIRSDVAFEEASVEASRKIAEKVAAIRAGNWQGSRKPRKRRRAPFRLRPVGPQAVALLWKNLISTGQALNPRLAITLGAVSVGMSIGLGHTTSSSSFVLVLGMFTGMLLLMSVLAGPQFLRQDFRQDLPLSDLLKSYPMPGWQIVLGEILAPVVVLTCVQWLLLILTTGFVSGVHDGNGPIFRISFGMAFGVAVLLPAFNLITMQIPNASVLLFPGWFVTGKDAPQGIELTGQRLIFFIGQFIVMVLSLVPASIAFVVVFFATTFFGLAHFSTPLSSLAAAIVLTLESAIGLVLLGKVFERMDVSSELSP
jgi:hypothetical protein